MELFTLIGIRSITWPTSVTLEPFLSYSHPKQETVWYFLAKSLIFPTVKVKTSCPNVEAWQKHNFMYLKISWRHPEAMNNNDRLEWQKLQFQKGSGYLFLITVHSYVQVPIELVEYAVKRSEILCLLSSCIQGNDDTLSTFKPNDTCFQLCRLISK